MLRVACAHIRVTGLQELPGVVVVHLEPVRLDVLPVAFDSEPLEVLGDHVVCVGVDLLGVGVLEPEDEVTAVPFDVLVVEDGHAGVSKVQGSGGAGCDTHDDLAVDVLELGELVLPLLLLLDQHRGVHFGQSLGLRLESHGVDLLHDLVDEGCDLSGLGPEFRASSEDLTNDRLGVGSSLEEHGVLKCEFSDRILDLVGHGCGDSVFLFILH